MTKYKTKRLLLKIGNTSISNKEAFVIAEIGNNHQGDLKKAFKLIFEAKNAGASAVKFQKRNNAKLFTKAFFNKPYDNPNSFGSTYGTHRTFLEFQKSDYKDLIQYADELKIEIFATPFDFDSVEFLENLNIKAFKIASADLRNTILQKEIAKTKKPIFLSTGGGDINDVQRAHENIMQINNKLAILHCTAAYPVEPKDMNLNVIKTYLKKFPKNWIGLSDHENGIDAASVAYLLGARIFEKHFTLNRAFKGTDHKFSLEPIGLKKMIRNLRRIPIMLGNENKKFLKTERDPIEKMSKSIVAQKKISKGRIIKIQDITFKSPGGGLDSYFLKEVIGKETLKTIDVDEKIQFKYLKKK